MSIGNDYYRALQEAHCKEAQLLMDQLDLIQLQLVLYKPFIISPDSISACKKFSDNGKQAVYAEEHTLD